MRLHLVDGTFELFRAHFSKRPDTVAPDGTSIKATVGVAHSMLTLLRDEAEAVTHLAVAFDNPIRSFRNGLFGGYKSDEGVPPELRRQFDLVEEVVRALGIVVWSMDRWEADDALATAAVRWVGSVDQVRILSPDKDLGQVLDGQRIVQVDRIRLKTTDEAAFRLARGIAPQSLPDWLALVGDTADGIPGIPGFGEKSASALLARFATLEGIPDDPAAWNGQVRGAERLALNLRERRADALLYRRLATLATDAFVPESLEELEWRGTPKEQLTAWCSRWGAGDLMSRIPRFRD